MNGGTIRVFENCLEFFQEKKTYHAVDGVPAKNQDNHCIDAAHKGLMMLERFSAAAYGHETGPEFHEGASDYEVFA
jgi:hypothetical protein